MSSCCCSLIDGDKGTDGEEIVYQLAKMVSKQVDNPDEIVDKSTWDRYRNELLSKSDDQLKLLAGKVAEFVTENPALRQFILLLALSQSS